MEFIVGILIFLFILFLLSVVILLAKLFFKYPVSALLIVLGINLFDDDCDV